LDKNKKKLSNRQNLKIFSHITQNMALNDLKSIAEKVLDIQKKAVNDLTITNEMLEAARLIIEKTTEGKKIITTGMGKAGIIATKMSATLSSIGIPSFYVHPAESLHGDLGRISQGEPIVAFSHSGSTSELISMLEALHTLNNKSNPIILITNSQNPKIIPDVLVRYSMEQESCVVKKVPSTSTTLMLITADIITITASEYLGLDDSWFKIRHPGGAIGEAYKKDQK